MAYHGKTQLTIIIVAPPRTKLRRGTASFGATDLGWRLPIPVKGTRALLNVQFVQGARDLEPDGFEFCPHWKHLLHPVRDL